MKRVNHLYIGKTLKGTLANSEEQDEMQHNAAFQLGLHSLLWLNQTSWTWFPKFYRWRLKCPQCAVPIRIVLICMGENPPDTEGLTSMIQSEHVEHMLMWLHYYLYSKSNSPWLTSYLSIRFLRGLPIKGHCKVIPVYWYWGQVTRHRSWSCNENWPQYIKLSCRLLIWRFKKNNTSVASDIFSKDGTFVFLWQAKP